MLLTLRYLGESGPKLARVQIELNEEPVPLQRVRLLVAYDGSAFSGFARNLGVTTVAGELETHLKRVLKHEVVITGAGRTDKGVHAWGQVVTFDTFADRLQPERLQRSINSVCGPAIAVRAIDLVDTEFDARFSAKWRRYRYTILTAATPNPFLYRYAWHVTDPISVDAMDEAGQAILGEHDFSSFCRRPPDRHDGTPATLVREVTGLRWERLEGDLLRCEITARAFCHQMVRSIVGTLVDVGRGRLATDQVATILAARDRNAAGDLAPPQGLCLHEVGY